MIEIVRDRFKAYAPKTLEQEKEALREIIQEIALLGLWRSKFFEHAAFYGGTALRILYGLDRFSEDLDFTLLNESKDFKLQSYCRGVRDELIAYGFDAEVEVKNKKQQTATESAFIKADTIIHLIKVESQFKASKGEVLKVKFELDTAPAKYFETEVKQFFWPHPYSVKTCDLPSLFAGKLHACFCRDRIANVKGRDFYDFLWYVGKGVKPNYTYLEAKLRQSGHWPVDRIFEVNAFRTWAQERIQQVDLSLAKRDVERFIRHPRVLDGWSTELFLEALDRITRSS